MHDDFPPENPDKEENAPDDYDLELENQALKDDLSLRGMVDMHCSNDLDPAVENEFLKHVLEFEDASREMGMTRIGDLFPEGYDFPPVEELDDAAVEVKMAEIRGILGDHGVVIEFNDSVPDRLAYEHITHETLQDEIMGPLGMPGYTYHLDGCSGCCEECFQLPYCETGQKIENEPGE